MKSFKFIYLAALIAFLANYSLEIKLSECDLEHSTICDHLNGTKSCCPVQQGICCRDVDFCCPKGFNCDSKKNRCVQDSLYIPFHLRLEKIDDESSENVEKVGKDILCPDNQTSCKETQTCCLFGQGDYGCCPIRDAVCCNDKIHCCPKNYICNPSQGKCDRNKTENGEAFSIKWFEKQQGKKINLENVPCPDKKTECPTGSTCCQLSSGQYACCPLPNAVCCEDHLHCCPNGYTCDVKDGRCNKGDISLPFYQKIPSIEIKEEKNVKTECPGGQDQCPGDSTCCQLSSGEWGCCPFQNAVCCEDHLHCCPQGYTCDVQDGRCNKGDISLPFYQKIKSVKTKEIKNIKTECPGGQDQCPGDSTCCQLSSGEWGCCPFQNAVCCEDHLHCCPQGYICDVQDGRCNKGDISLPFYQKIKSVKTKEEKNVKTQCPGGQDQCPGDSTCCQLSSGEWGCCPLQNAVCCEDHLHCCPQGYTCDVKDGRCNKGDVSLPFYLKTKSIKVNEEKNVNTQCPGGQSECPSQQTCCQLSSGEWGCCPIPQAVCCEDHLHCCPNGYTCDVKDGRCNKGDVSLPFYLKTKSIKVNEEKNVNTQCPGGQSECPSQQTCCQLSSGEWGCCPLPQAVCCEDHLHCCPNGYTCDVKDGRCNKGDESIPLFKKSLSQLIKKNFESIMQLEEKIEKILVDNIPEGNFKYDVNSVVCPDGCSFCPNGYTCCKMSDGSYGCCPLPHAVCCEDHLHCCPENSHCNLQKQSCDSDSTGNSITSLFDKIPSKLIYKHDKNLKENNDPVICADNVTTCDPLKTCCKMADDSYGCCPYSDGVCCSDLSYCCPGNSVCGKMIGECIPKKHESVWEKIETKAQEIPKKENLKDNTCSNKDLTDCDGTCCKKQDGNLSCCPYSNGTCCGTHGYCCPKDYTCNSQDESCTYNDPDAIKPTKIFTYKSISKRLARSQLNDNDDTFIRMVDCADGVHYCPDTSTCCKTQDSFGCCAIQNAVCCDDGMNCCPNGYKCQTNSTTVCTKKSFEPLQLN